MVLHLTNNANYDLLQNNLNLFQTLLGQPVQQIKDYLTKYKNAIIITIWLLSATILTACFESKLLGIYSSQKSIPMFNTLQDIIDNKDLKICCIGSLDPINGSDVYKKLESRTIPRPKVPGFNLKTASFVAISISEHYVADVVRGDTVLMLDTILSSMIDRPFLGLREDLPPFDFSLLIKSKNKYFPMVYSFTIDKHHPYSTYITQVYATVLI